MVETQPRPKTVTVRITREMADLIAEKYRYEGLASLHERLEPWVESMYTKGVVRAMKRKYAMYDKERDKKKRSATVKIPRSQLRRLAIIAPVYGRSISDMVETKLWEILA